MCHDLYINITKQLSEYTNIYLDSNLGDKIVYVSSKEEDERALKNVFDKYIGINLPDLKRWKTMKGFSKFRGRFSNVFAYRKWKNQLIDIVKHENPGAIICISDLQPTYKILKNSFPDLPFIFIQHGQLKKQIKIATGWSRIESTINDLVNFGTSLQPKNNLVGNQDLDTYYFFWTKKWTEHFPSKKKIWHIGATNYDQMFVKDFSSHKKTKKEKFGFDGSKPVLLIALNKSRGVGPIIFQNYISIYKSLIQYFSECQFIIKIHPNEDLEFCKKIFELEEGPDRYFIKDGDWEELLHASDLYISHWSSSLYLAIAASIPSIILCPVSIEELKKRHLHEFGYIAKNKSELKSIVHSFIYEEEEERYSSFRKTFIESTMLSSDGSNAKRAANAIRDITNS